MGGWRSLGKIERVSADLAEICAAGKEKGGDREIFKESEKKIVGDATKRQAVSCKVELKHLWKLSFRKHGFKMFDIGMEGIGLCSLPVFSKS